MPKIVEVPGIGRVRFPDSMSDADIEATIQNRAWEQRPPAQPTLNILPPQHLSLQAPVSTPTMGLEYPLAPVSLGGEPPTFASDDPFVPMGTGLTRAGQITSALASDAPEMWAQAGPLINPSMWLHRKLFGDPESRLEKQLPGYIAPPLNIEAVMMGEETPASYQAKFLGPVGRGTLKASQGFIESTPRLAAMTAATGGAGLPAWAAGGLAFGATEEGLDPKAAAIGAALPLAGTALAGLSKMAAVRMGVTQPEALNWIKGIVATVGPAGGLYGEQLYTINQMEREGLIDKDEADEQRLTALFSMGYNLGQGPMGVKWENVPPKPPIIPQRRTQNMLRELPGAEHLNELERAWVDREREAIDTPMRVVTDVDLTNTDDPFARSKKRTQTGIPMRMNKDTGELEIYPGELSDYLSGVPENRRGAALLGRFDEEEVHDATDPRDAAEFYQSLTPLSKAIFNRIYIGNAQGVDPFTNRKLSDAELGYEAVRIRLQQLNRAGPAEVAEAALAERWTVRSLLALDAIVRRTEETLLVQNKRNADRQREILQSVRDNLAVAKRTVETGEVPKDLPAARRKKYAQAPYDERTKRYYAMMRDAVDEHDRLKQSEMDLGPTERTTDASQDPQAAEVYGDMRAQSREGAPQVPTQEGGEGVQPPGILGPAARRKKLVVSAEEQVRKESENMRFLGVIDPGQFEQGKKDVGPYEKRFMEEFSTRKLWRRMEDNLAQFLKDNPKFQKELADHFSMDVSHIDPNYLAQLFDMFPPDAQREVVMRYPEIRDDWMKLATGERLRALNSVEGELRKYGVENMYDLLHGGWDEQRAKVYNRNPGLGYFVDMAVGKTRNVTQHPEAVQEFYEYSNERQISPDEILNLENLNYAEGEAPMFYDEAGLFSDFAGPREYHRERPEVIFRQGRENLNAAKMRMHQKWGETPWYYPPKTEQGELMPAARRKFNLEAKTEKEIVNELGRGLLDLLMSGLAGDKAAISDTVEGLGEFVKVLKGKIESGAFKDLDLPKLNAAISDVENAISQFPMAPMGGKQAGAPPVFENKLMEPTETIQATEDRVKHIMRLASELWNDGYHAESIEASQGLKKFIDDSANRFQDKIELEAGHSPDTVRRTQAFIDHLRMVSGRVELQLEADLRDQQHAFPAARRKRELTVKSFFDAANMLAGRTRYGYHTQPATKDSFIVSWSNGTGRWNVHPKDQIGFHGSISDTMKPWLKESDITSIPEGHVWLDANQILVNAKTRKEAELIAQNLPRHPLDEFSFENNPLFKEGSSVDDVVGFYENLSQVAMDFRGAKSPNVIDATSRFLDKLEPDSPAARRKKNLPEVQSGLDFEGPTSMVPKADKGPVEGATAPKFAPISPDILEKSVGEHILTNPDPSFNAFAKMASDRWGVQPGQLENVWKGQMWDTLMKATGRQLTELVFRLDLGGKLKLRKNLEKMAQARATESGEAVRQAPSIGSGENLVIANKMYGQIPDAPGAADPIVKQFLMEFEGQPSEMMTGLRHALKRAETAKKREAEYNKWFDQAKDLREQLRGLGFTNIDDAGNPTGGGVKASIAAKGIGRRLLHARKQMDELADPDYFTRPEERELVSKHKVRENIYPTDPKTGEQTSKHPIGTKVYTKLVSRGKAKVPEYESMARPGFSPGLPPRKGSAQTRAAQERRLRVIAALGERLLEQQQSKQEKLMRREVTPDDVAYYRGPEALRQLTPEEQRDVGTVSAIIGAAPAPDRATVTEKVVGGTKTTVRRERNTEAATRNLVALEDADTGRVYLVSTYTGGDGIVRVLNPGLMHLQRKHEALSPRLLRKYKPLWSVQLDQPVRDFMQRFENKDQFRREFVSEAKGRFADIEAQQDVTKLDTPSKIDKRRQQMAIQMALGVTDPEQFKTLDEQLRQRQAELQSSVSQKSGMYGEGRLVSEAVGNPNVTVQEAGAIWQALKLWQRKDPASVIAEFQRMQREAPKRSEFESQAEQQERSQSRLALIGLNKMLKQTEARGMGIAYMLQNVSRLSENRQAFIRNILTQYAKPEPPHEVGATRRPIGAAPEPSPTEVEIPSKSELAQRNYLREQIGLRPLGPQRDPAIHVPETYRRPPTKMMTPEEAEFVRQQRMTQGEVRPGIDTPTQTVGYYPHARNKMVRGAQNAIRDILLDPTGGMLRYYSGWMSQRLREGGGKTANATADIFDQIIDREKQLMGALTKHLDPALKAVGSPRLGTWLNGYDVIGGMAPDAAIGRSQGAIEGWLALPGSKLVGKGKNAKFTPSWADRGVQLARAANYAAGRMIEAVSPGFRATGKFERHLTSVGYEIIRTGSGPLYEAWLNGMAEANTPHTHARNTQQGMRDFLKTRSDAHDMFQRMKKILDDPTPDMIELDQVNQDFHRSFPRAVTHVRAPGRGIFGGWKEVLHSNMFNYLNATAKRASHMRSFREQFPNSVVGRSAFKKMREGIATEFDPNFRPGDKNMDAILGNFDALTRALQGHATDQYGHNRNWMHEVGRPGTAVGDISRFLNTTAMNLMAKLVLSKQLITQTGELMAGSTPQYLGYGNYARAARTLGGDALRKQSFFDLLGNPRKFLKDLSSTGQLYQQLEQQGMVNRVMYDWAFDPKTPITALTSGSKIVGNVISKVFMENLLNETQEAMAAATAKVTAERISSGNLSKWEQRNLPATFKAMGFQPGEINALMNGDPGLLDMFQRRAAAFLTGGNKHVAESSRIGANRLFNSIFRFQSYPMMKANQLRQDIINFQQAKTGGAKAVATEKLVRNFFFNTAQGAITSAVAAIMGGATAAGIKGSEIKDEPIKFILESWFAANSGPLYLLWRNSGDAGLTGAVEQVGRMMFPYSMANEFMDMANGVGAYRDQSLIEAVGTFMRKKTPGLAVAKTGMSYFGLGRESTDMSAARDAFYRWQRSEGFGGGRPGRPKDKEEAAFRLNMRRATAAIIAGDETKFLNSAYEAVAAKSSEEAAASLRGRRLLDGLSLEQKSSLMNRIGLKAYNILEGHDAMLVAAAERLNPPD